MFFENKGIRKKKNMEEDVTYSPKRLKKKKHEKKRPASDLIFPDSKYTDLFRSSDDEEDEDEDELKGAQDTIREARASAKQTSRLEGGTIVYDDTWRRFRERPARNIIEEDFHPLEGPHLDTEAQKQLADATKDADLMAYNRRQKIKRDRWRVFIDKVIGLKGLRPEDVYNRRPTDNPRTTFELPEILGLESISEDVSSHIEDAFTQVNLRSGTILSEIEDIIFSDDRDLINLFARLAWVRMCTSDYLNGLRPALESKLRHLREQENFLIIAIGKRLNVADVGALDSQHFPRTRNGFKKPRILLT